MRISARTRHSLLWLVMALLCVGTAAAAAETAPGGPEPVPSNTCPICRHANNQAASYPEQASGNLARGLTNTFFGWTEMLVRPTAEVERHGNLLNGIGQGVSHSLTRTAAGIGEALTFWMPKSVGGPPPLAVDCPICMSVRHEKSATSSSSPRTP